MAASSSGTSNPAQLPIDRLGFPNKTDGVSFFTADECNAIRDTINILVAAENVRRAASTTTTTTADPTFRQGTIVPPTALGVNSDVYLNTTNGYLYQKVAGQWRFLMPTRGADGKSAYQAWLDAGNVGNEAAFLTSLRGSDGTRGSLISYGTTAPVRSLSALDGDLYVEQISETRYRLHIFSPPAWTVLYTTPANVVIAPRSITNEMLAEDIAVGSLSAARNAYPLADQPILTTVEKFFVWIGAAITSLTSRVKALEDRLTGSTGSTGSSGGSTNGVTLIRDGDGTKFLANDGNYKTVDTGSTGGTGGAGVTLEQDLSSNSTTAAPSVSAVRTVTGLPANLTTTVKTSLVAATNEVRQLATDARSDVGTLASLTTTAKGSVVAAVNETRSVLAGSTVQTGAYTLVGTDAGNVVPISSAASVQVTVPPDFVTNFPIGTCMEISQEGAGIVTVVGGAGVTLTAFGGTKTAGRYAALGLRKMSANSWRVTGGVA